MKIWIFSNVAFAAEEAPQVGADDLLVFLNKAFGIGFYREHYSKVVYHRSPDKNYGDEIMGCVNRYVFSAGNASMPKDFIEELKRSYDWEYAIEPGKTKCMTTGYMVAMYMRHIYPDAEIALVNFGFSVKNSTYRCPYHNWQFEDRALAGFDHIYTSGKAEPDNRKKVFYELSGWLGDNVYASAVVTNMACAGFDVNVSENGHAALWDPCRVLKRNVTRENADIVIRQRNLHPWTCGCPHIVEGVTDAAAYDLNTKIPIFVTRPHIWINLAKERIVAEKYVVLNTGWQNSAPTKKWARENWEKLIALCPDVRFVQMGQSKNHAVPLPGVIDMIDKTDLPDLLRLVRDAACVVSPPSGAIHIAGAFRIPNIMLSGGREPATLAAYPETVAFSSCAGRLDCCKSAGCHRNRFGTAENGCGAFRVGSDGETAQCMLDITPEEVAGALKKIIKKEG